MLQLIKIVIYITSLTLLVSCAHEHDQGTAEEHEHGGVSITQYTDLTEIFMEYSPLLINQEAEFLIHLTDLKNFKAVTEGELTIEFSNERGDIEKVIENKPARDGIYIPNITFKNAGKYKMTITLRGNQVSDIIIVEDIIVYANFSELPHIHEEETSDITFLKEQQWKIEFANEAVETRMMRKSIKITGDIKQKPEYYVNVVSPVGGTVLVKNNAKIKSVGDYVKSGDILLNISPSADAGKSIQKIKNDYTLVESEYERVKNLYDKKAVSKKRLEEARVDFETIRESYNSLTDQIKISDGAYSIISPINGFIERINFNLGDQLEPGKELFTIVNPSRLILQANAPSKYTEEITNSSEASFIIEGFDKEYSISELRGEKISVSTMVNEINRTVSIIYEFSNPQNKFKIGMFADVYVKIGDEKKCLAVPKSAIIDEDGLHTAYVQIEGEAFERRILTTGIIDNGYVEVLEGLNEGERVVTKGAYQVRLAALSPESAIGHGHVH